jgi:hypothetical protein
MLLTRRCVPSVPRLTQSREKLYANDYYQVCETNSNAGVALTAWSLDARAVVGRFECDAVLLIYARAPCLIAQKAKKCSDAGFDMHD